MLLYYHIDRSKDTKKYIISLYYRGLLGQFKEMHRSYHKEIKDLNEVIQHYRHAGYLIQSMAAA